MTRYLKQRDHFSCGPHALINAFKFQGGSETAEDLAYWKDRCGCGIVRRGRDDWNGTSPLVLGRHCQHFGYYQLWRPDMRKIDLALQRGHAILVQVLWTRRRGHYFLITERKKRWFRCINLYVNEKSGWVSKRKFWKHHRHNVREFRAWIIPKCL